MVAQVEEVPAVAAEDAQRPGFRLQAGVQFARDQLDERGFAGPVRAQDGDVFALRDGERDAVEYDAVVALHRDVLKFDEGNQFTILSVESVLSRPRL